MTTKRQGKNTRKANGREFLLIKIIEETEEEKCFQPEKVKIDPELLQRLEVIQEKRLILLYEDAQKRNKKAKVTKVSLFRGSTIHIKLISNYRYTHRAIVHKSEIWFKELTIPINY
ncbi:MAG: hypothetical protein PHI66_01285 [Candidatus Pacebacteria bacterium]|nr:hypothetical protein [Candidatus Paceibacterota bacterium]